MYTHIFQPLGSGGLRMGMTGQVHNAMFQFGKDGDVDWCFGGTELLKGETDGSSYQNGGLRATHTAGGYTALDPSSNIYIRGDTVFIPTTFVSFFGDALDEKTPLLRSMQVRNRHLPHTDERPLPPLSTPHPAPARRPSPARAPA